MWGFRPRPKRSDAYPQGSTSKKNSLLEDEKFFSDEDEFDNLYYSERDKDYVKKPTKWIPSLINKPQQGKLPPTRPHPPCTKSQSEELSRSDDLPQNISTSTNDTTEVNRAKGKMSATKIKKGSGMVLTKERSLSGISKTFKGLIAHPPGGNKGKDEGVKESQLKNVVSLHLQMKGFQKIMTDAFESFGSLAHLYLYDNKITEMVGLSSIPQLESLYLSGNRIKRIEDLEKSFNLRQLYLGQNEIEVIEGLENCSMLVELHVECQKLPLEQALIFCPNSVETISRKLKVLNTSGNQLESIEDLSYMEVLDTLNLSRNKLTKLNHVSQVLRRLKQLRVLDLRENSILKDRKYKEQIIGYCGGLELLDGKEINETQRTTLQRMCAMKESRIRNQKLKNQMKNPIHPVPSFPGAFHHQLHPEEIMQTRSMTMTMMMPIPISIDVSDNPNENFVFSTPISMSPTPDQGQHYPISRAMMISSPLDGTHLDEADVEIAMQNEVAKFYEGRCSNILPADDGADDSEKMSEMAKIIFRLSNLSPSQETIVGKSSKSDFSSPSPYWTNSSQGRGFGDRSTTFKESRPLSPLELELDVNGSSSQTMFLHNTRSSGGLSVGKRTLRRPMARKLPPRSQSVLGAGRTLSPLEELPTPDSTIKDPNEGRHYDWFSPQSSLQPSTCSLPTLSELPKKKGIRGVGGKVIGFTPSVTKIKSEKVKGKP